MTSIEWLLEQLEQKGDMRETPSIRNLQLNIDTSDYLELKRQAKEMHKAEIIDAYFEGAYGGDNISGEQYYQETFVSKGSGMSEKPNKVVEFDHFKTDESWEGCDGCTEQDEIMYKNGYVKGYNAAISELPKEISDEEIEKGVNKLPFNLDQEECFIMGATWYRELLKLKQCTEFTTKPDSNK